MYKKSHISSWHQTQMTCGCGGKHKQMTIFPARKQARHGTMGPPTTLSEATERTLATFLQQFKVSGASCLTHRVTHTLLTRPFGKFCVPAASLPDFVALYIAVVVRGGRPGFVEIKPKGEFRLFADIDLKFSPGQVLDAAAKATMLATMQSVAVTMFGPSEARVASCEPYMDAKSGLVKGGLHVVWPDLYVDGQQALAFREASVAALGAACGTACPGTGTWRSALDATVYKEGTGLRMLGAGKKDPKATAYLPDCIVAVDGTVRAQVDPSQAWMDIKDWLLLSSLCHGRLDVEPAPEPGRSSVRAAPRPRMQQLQCIGIDQAVGRLLPQECPELVQAVRDIISRPGAEDFKAAAVKWVKPYDDPRFGPCALVIVDSKRCLNLRGRACHSGNHTYLVVQGDRVCQKCHSSRREEVVYGPCSSFNIDISGDPSFMRSALISPEQYREARARLPRLLKQLSEGTRQPQATCGAGQDCVSKSS
jgi:hypothetical protein